MSNGKPSYILSVFKNKCPRCRQGDLFITGNAYALKHSNYMKMHEYCPVCGQRTEIEVGFYYGTSYVSYAVTVGFTVITCAIWWLLIGFSINDNRLFWWLGLNSGLMILMQPLFMRHSRTLWLSWFVKYDPDWKDHPAREPERIIEGEMKNW